MSVISRYRWRISIRMSLIFSGFIFALVFALSVGNLAFAASNIRSVATRSPTPPVITRRKLSRAPLPLAIRSFRHSSKAASLMAEVPTSALRLPPMVV